jgi:hypothetical protein
MWRASSTARTSSKLSPSGRLPCRHRVNSGPYPVSRRKVRGELDISDRLHDSAPVRQAWHKGQDRRHRFRAAEITAYPAYLEGSRTLGNARLMVRHESRGTTHFMIATDDKIMPDEAKRTISSFGIPTRCRSGPISSARFFQRTRPPVERATVCGLTEGRNHPIGEGWRSTVGSARSLFIYYGNPIRRRIHGWRSARNFCWASEFV